MSATPAAALEDASPALPAAAPRRIEAEVEAEVGIEAADHVTVTPLGPALGAEVGGLDLSRPLTAAELEAVRGAIQAHHLLCFRGQRLDSREQVAFSKQLGPLEVFPEQDKTKGENTVYNVANVSPEGEHLPVDDHRVIYQKVNARWHTDSSYRYLPSFVSIMYAIRVLPDGAKGGETEFSNMLAAYDTLPGRAQGADRAAPHGPLLRVRAAPLSGAPARLPPRTRARPADLPPARPHPPGPRLPALALLHDERRQRGERDVDGGRGRPPPPAREPRVAARALLPPPLAAERPRALGQSGAHAPGEGYDMARHPRVFRRTTVAGSVPILGPFSQAVEGKVRPLSAL